MHCAAEDAALRGHTTCGQNNSRILSILAPRTVLSSFPSLYTLPEYLRLVPLVRVADMRQPEENTLSEPELTLLDQPDAKRSMTPRPSDTLSLGIKNTENERPTDEEAMIHNKASPQTIMTDPLTPISPAPKDELHHVPSGHVDEKSGTAEIGSKPQAQSSSMQHIREFLRVLTFSQQSPSMPSATTPRTRWAKQLTRGSET